MYEMKEEYLTGIEEIDNEHRRLFEIAEETYRLLHESFISDKYDDVKHLLNELREYTITHFEHEEAYMESIGYKRLFSQKMQHAAFVEKLENFDLELIDETSDDMINEILQFLTNWLVEHILLNDKLIGEQK